MAATTQPRIFKKIEVIEGGGHHGGGWKVAYADFMTAMMAFFLLMWILASADEAKLRGIAEYFTDATLPGGTGVLDGATLGPPGTLTASNGTVVARGSELGKMDDPSPSRWEVRDETSTSDPQETAPGSQDGAIETPASDGGTAMGETAHDPSNAPTDANKVDEHAIDHERFKALQAEVMEAMDANPVLDGLKQNIAFKQTPEGLQIEIIDQAGKPMFLSGRAEMHDATALLLQNLGKSLSGIPNSITLAGHTDGVRFADGNSYDNWDLSSDRANATRRVFEGVGVARDRILRVSGLADTELLVPEQPTDPTNRRISVSVQYQALSKPAVKQAMSDSADTAEPITPMQTPEAPVQRVAEVRQPKAAQLNDDVFLNLRNALR